AAEAWLQQSGKADMTVRDLGSLESILGLVEAGLGFTVAPETAILGYRAANALDLTPLPAPHDVSETVLCWRIDHRVTAPLRSLRDLVTEERAAA
ncbi:MAG: LysR substrate-binding domain-containing protein, partial [Pseudomonadota bacterium]